MRTEAWVIALRPDEQGKIAPVEVYTLVDLFRHSTTLGLRMRYNPDIHLFTIRLPPGATHQKVADAAMALTEEERLRAYNMPKHRLAG